MHVPSLTLNGPTVLVTLTGPDRPGVSTRLFTELASFGSEVIDIEQLVVRGRLVLAVLVPEPTDVTAFEERLDVLAGELGFAIDFERGVGDNRPHRAARVSVTVLGAPLRADAMARLTARIKAAGGNIDRILRLARYPVTAIRLSVSGAEPDTLQSDLAAAAADFGIDIAVQESGIHRHAQRLIVMDVDSTLIQGEVIEMLAAHAGREAEVAAITDEAMRGDIDFAESLRRRVAMLEGVPASALVDVYRTIEYAPGARTMIRSLKRLGFRFALVSGGFTQIIEQIADELQIDYFAANQLEIEGGELTGRVIGDVVDRPGKARALERFASEAGIAVKNTIAIGDGANDLDMLAASGLGVAFNAKPVVRSSADTSVTVPYLDAVVYLLGITREEIESADAADDQSPS